MFESGEVRDLCLLPYASPNSLRNKRAPDISEAVESIHPLLEPYLLRCLFLLNSGIPLNN